MRKNLYLANGILLLATLSLLPFGCASSGGGGGGGGGGGDTNGVGDATAGEAIYNANCRNCHGTPGQDDGPAPGASDLADFTAPQLDDGATAEGHPDLPELTGDDYDDLAAYLAQDDDDADGDDGGDRIDLDVVKLNYAGTTARGPAAGDGVLAFDADGGEALVWVRAGETEARVVPAPQGMDHSRTGFAFAGRKLVVQDQLGGSLYVFDTDNEEVVPVPPASIDLGGSGGSSAWEADGNWIATLNTWVTTEDGQHKLIKVVDISDLSSLTITPFEAEPPDAPDTIRLDADEGRFVVRAGEAFYVYDIDSPNAPPTEFSRAALQGGTGSSDMRISGNFVAFFDDDENFTLLNISTGQFTQPNRNPGRSGRGLELENDRFAYFAMQTDDDGNSIAQVNRALVGTTDNMNNLIDPAGTFVNGQDEFEGRVGFGATASVSPNGRYVFVAGETAVGVDERERLYISIDGAGFLMVEDSDDPLNAQRACGVSASDNLVAFLIPAQTGASSSVAIGYATLPPR